MKRKDKNKSKARAGEITKKASDKSTDKTSAKSTAKATAKSTDSAAEKSTDKTQDKAPKLVGFAAFKAQVWEYSKAIAFALFLALTIRSFVIQAFHIPSGSMIPTFLEGDRVMVTKFVYGVRNPFTNNVLFKTGLPKRGDVVIFRYPLEPEVDFVKRVIGLPGEKIQIIRGKIFINDQPIDDPHGHYDNPYITGSARDYGPSIVPDESYFMMGDNRDYSNDSRSWGTVHISFLRGKAWRLYWSWDTLGEDRSFFQRLRKERLWKKIE
ncbi:MAG: signal peptidase I [Deltaproteobacteria bacterium]|nr:signal peptidase I [Deltaproteobacteria bacterium]